MTDAVLLELLDSLPGRPQLTVGDRRYIHVDGAVLEWHRVGKRERWSFSPSHGIKPIGALPTWWPREVRQWAHRAEVLNVAAHARAMAARVQ